MDVQDTLVNFKCQRSQGVWGTSLTTSLIITLIKGTSFKKVHPKVSMGRQHVDKSSPLLPRTLSPKLNVFNLIGFDVELKPVFTYTSVLSELLSG